MAKESHLKTLQRLRSYGSGGGNAAGLLFVLAAVVALFLNHGWLAGFFILMALFGSRTEEKRDPIKLKKLEDEEKHARGRLQTIYSQFIELPPDWQERRFAVRKRDHSRCQDCGKRFRSNFGFHLHHVEPKSDLKNSHKLSNLILLCEKCHKKRHPWMR